MRMLALQRGETVTAATARFNHMLQERAREKDGGRENFQGVEINKRKVKSGCYIYKN
jgi:hypothetical protein